MSSRKSLITAWQNIETLSCALEGKATEMTDKEAIRVITKALWLVLDLIVRRIDKEKGENE